MSKRKCTNLCVVAYKLKDSETVVINKSQIKNAKEEGFEKVSLFIPESFIKEKYERMNNPSLNDRDDDEYSKDIQEELDEKVCKNCILFVNEVKRIWSTKPSYCIKDYNKVDGNSYCSDFCKTSNPEKCKSCKVYNCIHNDVNDCDEGHAF